MKSALLLICIFIKTSIGLSQTVFNGFEGIKDTSNYNELRNKIDYQNKFIKIDSNDVSAYFERAALEYQLGNYQTCISEQNEILRRFPSYAADVYTNKGMCYCFLKQYDVALTYLEMAKSLNPDRAKCYLNLAFAYTGLLNYKRAIEYLDTAISLKENYAKAFANRGFAKAQLKNFKDAIQDYNKALEIQASYPEVYLSRGYAEFNLGNFKNAIADYNKALKLLPALSQFYDFYQSRGEAYEKNGDIEMAKLDFETVKKLKQ